MSDLKLIKNKTFRAEIGFSEGSDQLTISVAKHPVLGFILKYFRPNKVSVLKIGKKEIVLNRNSLLKKILIAEKSTLNLEDFKKKLIGEDLSELNQNTLDKIVATVKQVVVPQVSNVEPLPLKKSVAARSFCSLPDFVIGLMQIYNYKAESGGHFESTQVLLDQRYYQDPEASFLTFDGEHLAPHASLPAFAIGPCHILKGKNFDLTSLKKVLLGYANLKPRPAKLFVPTPVYPSSKVAHALLLVVEADPADQKAARISIVNTLSGGYGEEQKIILQAAKEVFSSSKTTAMEFNTRQQSDGFSCGWQMIENIEVLKSQQNAQEFIQNEQLPKRSSEEIKKIYEKIYIPLVELAIDRYNTVYTDEERLKARDFLIREGRLSESVDQ